MKFKFKKQQFQTDAADSVVQVFSGQPNTGISKYRRDIGKVKHLTIDEQLRGRGSLLGYADKSEAEQRADEEAYETAYRNEQVHLSSEDLLRNINLVQRANNINRSHELVTGLGSVSLDVEMETGERVIIVTGCINVLVPRVSEAFIGNNSCIAKGN